MNRKIIQRTVGLLAAVLLFLGAGWCMAAPRFTIMTEELPPYNFLRNGEVYGVSADILLQILEQNNVKVAREEIQLLPWPRAYRMALEQPGSVLFSTARTPERESLFKWVGPITRLTIGLLARRDRHITLSSLADAARYTVGTVRDGAPEQLLARSGVPQSSLERIASPEKNIRKLQAGRIDLFAFNIPTTRCLMLRMGIDPDDYVSVYTLREVELYYAFHPDTDDGLIRALNRSMAELRRPGSDGRSEVDRITEAYLSH
jgi:ABC-type amino acid transport substrate-binding protein